MCFNVVPIVDQGYVETCTPHIHSYDIFNTTQSRHVGGARCTPYRAGSQRGYGCFSNRFDPLDTAWPENQQLPIKSRGFELCDQPLEIMHFRPLDISIDDGCTHPFVLPDLSRHAVTECNGCLGPDFRDDFAQSYLVFRVRIGMQ